MSEEHKSRGIFGVYTRETEYVISCSGHSLTWAVPKQGNDYFSERLAVLLSRAYWLGHEAAKAEIRSVLGVDKAGGV